MSSNFQRRRRWHIGHDDLLMASVCLAATAGSITLWALVPMFVGGH